MEKTEISAGILAGGRSSRMGTNKAFIRINNESIISRLIRELSCLDEIIISAAERGIYEDTGLKVVYDDNKNIGPIEGIRQLLKAASSEYVFICAADMPFISSELAKYLAGYISSDHDCYVIKGREHIEPLCAIYKRSILPDIEELISQGRYRLRDILDRVRTGYISLEHTVFDEGYLKNINTRQELLEIKKPFVFCVSGYSDSGKTTLITRLVTEFKDCGLKIAVLKHDGCDSYEDLPGSDTALYREAGADISAIFTDSRFSLHCRGAKTCEEMTELIKSLYPSPDYIIIEGMKDSSYPMIALSGGDNKSLPEKDNIICKVSNDRSPEKTGRPVFNRDDIRGIFDFIRKYFEEEL